MRAGDLNRTIAIMRQVEIGRDIYDEPITEWQSIHRPRAGVKWAKVEERVDATANQRFAAATVTFKIRWLPDVLPTDIIRFDRKNYNIVGQAEIGRRVGLELTATWRQGELP